MSKKKYTKSLRSFRVYHRFVGLLVAVILFISAVTGLLLAWKKNIDAIQPTTKRGPNTELNEWKPIGELAEIAKEALYNQHPELKGNPIKKIDIRPKKGVAKMQFSEGFWEVQLDGATGEILHVAKRHSDWIEDLHDGSIISENFKLLSMNVLGFGTIILIITGFWLWFGVRLIKKRKIQKAKGKLQQKKATPSSRPS